MENMEKNFDKWRKQYGDVFTIHMGNYSKHNFYIKLHLNSFLIFLLFIL